MSKTNFKIYNHKHVKLQIIVIVKMSPRNFPPSTYSFISYFDKHSQF